MAFSITNRQLKKMRIGFLLPSIFSVGNPGSGIRAQARFQAEALERAGHEVIRLSPWDSYAAGSLDVLQYFQGGFSTYHIEIVSRGVCRLLAFAPIIDSNKTNTSYRMASAIGNLSTRICTVPGIIRQQCMSSDLIICRSIHEQDRIVSGLGVPAEKTELVLNGVNPSTSIDSSDIKKKYGLPDEYILHVSAYSQERKNVLRMVAALLPTGYPIVIAGAARPGPVVDQLRQVACNNPNLWLLDFITDEELTALYAACKVFCLPSLHEGTGLVALEAASYGAKVVITSNGGPTDYFGALAKYVNPYDEASIQEQVVAAWTEPTSHELRDHVLGHLSWDKSASALVGAYERRLQEH